MKLFSKYSNLCDCGTQTSWTYRVQTDGQTADILWHDHTLRSIAR